MAGVPGDGRPRPNFFIRGGRLRRAEATWALAFSFLAVATMGEGIRIRELANQHRAEVQRLNAKIDDLVVQNCRLEKSTEAMRLELKEAQRCVGLLEACLRAVEDRLENQAPEDAVSDARVVLADCKARAPW